MEEVIGRGRVGVMERAQHKIEMLSKKTAMTKTPNFRHRVSVQFSLYILGRLSTNLFSSKASHRMRTFLM
jgi:uncharacterized protein YejL (UPF0352 family)